LSEPTAQHSAVEQVRDLLQESVRVRLVSDVPLGAFLSGGLDSSAVVALMRQATSGPIRTCSIVFDEAEYSEAHHARTMAEAVGAEHHERVVTAQDVEREWDRAVWAMDQPTCDGVNTYFVSQTAREAGLTVALSGLGGDELFGGYPNTFAGVPQLLRALTVAHAVPAGAPLTRAAVQLLPSRDRWGRLRDALSRPVSPASAYLARRGLFSASEVEALVGAELWREAWKSFDPVQHIAARADGEQNGSGYRARPLAWVSRAELMTYTHHQLLRDTDVMSMAHSLEVRVPLLDHKLAEAVLRLPAECLGRDAIPKPLLRDAVADLLPPAIRDRRDKQGFVFPFDRWMQRLHRKRPAPDSRMPDVSWNLNRGAVDRVWALHASGKMHWSRPWALLVLEQWRNGCG
jgi:asparagine synthase (glutamine-hydrolysing)